MWIARVFFHCTWCSLDVPFNHHLDISKFIEDENMWMKGSQEINKNWATTNFDDFTVLGLQQRWLRYFLHTFYTFFTARNLNRITKMTAPTHSTSRWPSCDHAPQLIVPLQQREITPVSIIITEKPTHLVIQLGIWNLFCYLS